MWTTASWACWLPTSPTTCCIVLAWVKAHLRSRRIVARRGWRIRQCGTCSVLPGRDGRGDTGRRDRQIARAASSDTDRMPDGLHLEPGRDPLGPFGGAVVEPVELRVGPARRATGEPLDVVGGDLLDRGPEIRGHAPGVDRVDIDVGGQDRDELVL